MGSTKRDGESASPVPGPGVDRSRFYENYAADGSVTESSTGIGTGTRSCSSTDANVSTGEQSSVLYTRHVSLPEKMNAFATQDCYTYLQALYPYASYDQLMAIVTNTTTADEAGQIAYEALNPDYTALPYLKEQLELKMDTKLPKVKRAEAFSGVKETLEERARDILHSGMYSNLSQMAEYNQTVQIFAIDTAGWDSEMLLGPRTVADTVNMKLPVSRQEKKEEEGKVMGAQGFMRIDAASSSGVAADPLGGARGSNASHTRHSTHSSSMKQEQQQDAASLEGMSFIEDRGSCGLHAPIARWAPLALRVEPSEAVQTHQDMLRVFDDSFFNFSILSDIDDVMQQLGGTVPGSNVVPHLDRTARSGQKQSSPKPPRSPGYKDANSPTVHSVPPSGNLSKEAVKTSIAGAGRRAKQQMVKAKEGVSSGACHPVHSSRGRASTHEPFDGEDGSTDSPGVAAPLLGVEQPKPMPVGLFADKKDSYFSSSLSSVPPLASGITSTYLTATPRMPPSMAVATQRAIGRHRMRSSKQDVLKFHERVMDSKPLGNIVFQRSVTSLSPPEMIIDDNARSGSSTSAAATSTDTNAVNAFEAVYLQRAQDMAGSKAIEPTVFLTQQEVYWEGVINLLRSFEAVFDAKFRCDLVPQLYENCPRLVAHLSEIVSRLLPVFSQELVGYTVVYSLNEIPIKLPLSAPKLFSTGPIIIKQLLFDVAKSSLSFGDSGRSLVVKLRIKKFELEPIAFAYIDEVNAAKQDRRAHTENKRRSRARSDGGLQSKSSRNYVTGTTKGTAQVKVEDVKLKCLLSVWIYASGKVYLSLDDVKVSIGSTSLSTDITKLNAFLILAKPFIKSAVEKQMRQMLGGLHMI